jgi:hypothetical protein
MFSRWGFRFLLLYICVLYTQPQNRFLFLHPLHIADLCILLSLGFHVLGANQEGRPIIRFGPATKCALAILGFGLLAQYGGALQTFTGWNGYIDTLVKSVAVLIMVEAMATSVARVWAVQGTILLASLWWIKAGLRLSAAGATYAGDRIMGPAVSLAENPNGFAYMFCVIIPIYLYFFQQYHKKYLRWAFLAMALAAIYIVFQTGSRTGMVVLVVCSAFLIYRYFWQYKLAMCVSSVAIFFLFSSVGYLNVQRFKSIPQSIKSFLSNKGDEIPVEEMDQDQQSAYERRMKNKHTWALILQYPVFGVGMYSDDSKLPEGLWGATGQVHNELLMAGKQMGVVGIFMYLYLLYLLFFTGWRVQKSLEGWWPAGADLGWTFKLQGIVFLIGGAFSPLPWNAPMFILVGAVSALATNLAEQSYGLESASAAELAPAAAMEIQPAVAHRG